MNRLAELTTIIIAGAVGSVIVVLALGASLLLVVPVTLGVLAIALVADHQPRSHATDREPQEV